MTLCLSLTIEANGKSILCKYLYNKILTIAKVDVDIGAPRQRIRVLKLRIASSVVKQKVRHQRYGCSRIKDTGTEYWLVDRTKQNVRIKEGPK